MTETKPGRDLYTELLKIPAIAALPGDEFTSLARTVYNELEFRVGTALSQGLSDAQLARFEELITDEEAHPEHAGQGLGASWLATNHPHYQDVVLDTITVVLAEVAAHFTTPPSTTAQE